MGEMGVCPVCRKPFAQSLSEIPFLKKKSCTLTKEQKQRRLQILSITRKEQTPANCFQMRTTLQRLCPPSENEAVVSTKCGHIFHKFCLRDYCHTFRSLRKTGLVECPICMARIVMTGATVLDLRALEGYSEVTDQKLKLAKVMHKELQEQYEPLLRKIETVRLQCEEEGKVHAKMEIRAKKIRDQWELKKWEYDQIVSAIEKVKALDNNETKLSMENRKLTTIYLALITDKLATCPPNRRIPEELYPYLKEIQMHPEVIDTFREIVCPLPIPNRKPVNTEELVKRIIDRVRPILLTGGESWEDSDPEYTLETAEEADQYFQQQHQSVVQPRISHGTVLLRASKPRSLVSSELDRPRLWRPKSISSPESDHIRQFKDRIVSSPDQSYNTRPSKPESMRSSESDSLESSEGRSRTPTCSETSVQERSTYRINDYQGYSFPSKQNPMRCSQRASSCFQRPPARKSLRIVRSGPSRCNLAPYRDPSIDSVSPERLDLRLCESRNEVNFRQLGRWDSKNEVDVNKFGDRQNRQDANLRQMSHNASRNDANFRPVGRRASRNEFNFRHMGRPEEEIHWEPLTNYTRVTKRDQLERRSTVFVCPLPKPVKKTVRFQLSEPILSSRGNPSTPNLPSPDRSKVRMERSNQNQVPVLDTRPRCLPPPNYARVRSISLSPKKLLELNKELSSSRFPPLPSDDSFELLQPAKRLKMRPSIPSIPSTVPRPVVKNGVSGGRDERESGDTGLSYDICLRLPPFKLGEIGAYFFG